MLGALLGRFGFMEALLRCTLEKFPRLKNKLKHKQASPAVGERNDGAWQAYREKILQYVGEDSIVLCHSAMDEFAKIGVSEKDVMALFEELVAKGNTVVLPAFPMTNLKPPTEKSRPYDPEKTLCWTGLLPNTFLAHPLVRRSVYPFNSLAALGPERDNMLEGNEKSLYVYDEHSAWAYCVKKKAKILFLGSPAHSANTVGFHMVPDVMGERWPVEDWYEEVTYKVRINGRDGTHTVRFQAGKWYKYVEEYATNRFLVKEKLLSEEEIGGCYLGFVPDSEEMIAALVKRCEAGKLMYCIPKRYYKKRK